MEIESNVIANLLTTKEAAAMLKISPRTLEHWREIGGGPVFLKVGPRTVRYRTSALDEFMATSAATSTAEASPTSRLLRKAMPSISSIDQINAVTRAKR